MDEDLIRRLYELYCFCMSKETLAHWPLNKFMEFFKTRSNEVINRNFKFILYDYIDNNKYKYIDIVDYLRQLINTNDYTNLIIAFELTYKRFKPI